MQLIILVLKNYLKHSNQTQLLLHSMSAVTSLLLRCHAHSMQITRLVVKEGSSYVKHSNQMHLLLRSISEVTKLFHFILTQLLGTSIGNEGGIKLSEVLKSNSSLTSIELSSNRLITPSFQSHSIKVVTLLLKE
jgi:hypothetical protein